MRSLHELGACVVAASTLYGCASSCPREPAAAPAAATAAGPAVPTSTSPVDPARLVWQLDVTPGDGQRESVLLSADAAPIPKVPLCEVGPVEWNRDKGPSYTYFAVRALSCTRDGVTFSALSVCAAEREGSTLANTATMTVREGETRGPMLSLLCRGK